MKLWWMELSEGRSQPSRAVPGVKFKCDLWIGSTRKMLHTVGLSTFVHLFNYLFRQRHGINISDELELRFNARNPEARYRLENIKLQMICFSVIVKNGFFTRFCIQ